MSHITDCAARRPCLLLFVRPILNSVRYKINAKFDSKFEKPVVYYRQLKSMASVHSVGKPAYSDQPSRLRYWRR
jgi:hypothetical protein